MRRQEWVPTTWIGPGLLLALAAFLTPTHALAVPQPCTEAGLDAALAAGGMQTFICAPGSTITISGTKDVGTNVTLDGGGNLTIGGGACPVSSERPASHCAILPISTRMGKIGQIQNRANTRGSKR